MNKTGLINHLRQVFLVETVLKLCDFARDQWWKIDEYFQRIKRTVTDNTRWKGPKLTKHLNFKFIDVITTREGVRNIVVVVVFFKFVAINNRNIIS